MYRSFRKPEKDETPHSLRGAHLSSQIYCQQVGDFIAYKEQIPIPNMQIGKRIPKEKGTFNQSVSDVCRGHGVRYSVLFYSLSKPLQR